MKKICKGNLYFNLESNREIYLGNYKYDFLIHSDTFKPFYQRLRDYEKNSLLAVFNNSPCGKNLLTSKNSIDILNKIFGDTLFFQPSMYQLEILYEELVDDYGITYGKELHTGYLFPVNIPREYKEYQYYFRKIEYIHLNENSYHLTREVLYNLPTMHKCECLIKDSAVADQNEIIEYKEKFSMGFGRKRKERFFREQVEYCYNKNVYKEEIKEKAKEPIIEREKQDKTTKLMDNIEFLLIKLKKINLDLYNKYNDLYQKMINSEKDPSPIYQLSLLSLSKLEADIEITVLTSKANADNILIYLDNLKKEYLTNFFMNSDSKTKLTLSELERINELFLRINERFTIKEQREVLKNLSMLYLLELKENIDSINADNLQNSYINDCLKTILISIEALKDLGMIKSNIFMELNEELTIKNIIEIIKEMEFVNVENDLVKDLVKKLTI